jgi:hypothetical protein
MKTSKVFKKLAMAAVGTALINLGMGKAAYAALLGSVTETINTGVGGFDNIPIANEFQVIVSIPETPGPFPRSSDPTLFRGTIISPSSVGQTFTATQETDPDFNDVVSFLTNGKTNPIDISFNGFNGFGGGGLLIPETFFTGNPSQTDFLGSSIDSISLLISSLTVTSTTSDNGFIENSFFARITLSINGQPSNNSSCGL